MSGARDRGAAGFTLVELMIVVVILGILSAIAIPNLIAVQHRAKEAGVKGNMHTLQLASEDFYVMNDRRYATAADSIVRLLPGGSSKLVNPFGLGTGLNVAYEDVVWANPIATSGIRGIVAYGDSLGELYRIAGRGRDADLAIEMTSGSARQATVETE
jgi:general secretion pathway protein G